MPGGQGGIRYPWEAFPAEGEATQIAEGVLWCSLPLPSPLKQINVYALDDGDGWTIVDTGLNSGLTRALWETLLAGPLAGKPVSRVLVTHHHPDHVGLAGWFQSRGAALITTRTAWLFARMLTLDEQAVPTPESLAFWRGAGMNPDIYAERETSRPLNFADMVAPLPLGFTRIAQGDTLTAGGRTWDIHIGNGHAPEHATLWSRDDDLVLAGDQVLPSISSNLGVYATEPEADPVGDWLESCERLSQIAEERHLVLPGHKRPFTGLPLRLRQLIANHHGSLARLLEYLDEPRAAGECFAPLYKRRIGPGEYGLALVEAVGHLNHLHRQGAASRERRDDGAWVFRRL
ncbi:Glyoxylase, beta-lactamase superfamily II [Poseidonocella pacifica]|uniref:Glyoxylase, beta-lactamase superfamily II n=1 Tax=Poseidonocella pacifica TaxID=871651 RepID=A0A1I0XI27_9RHOB|nr:MBL fold metallo-hydrolase [Poseidonocella pacifica]SFA99940.1 Glyoxylase, beta-lactamase superfamily II [Poseidonocella pacifica]